MSSSVLKFRSIYSEMKKDSSGFVKKTNMIGEFMSKNRYSSAQTYRIFLEEEEDWEEVRKHKTVLVRPKIRDCEGITLHGLPCRSKQRNNFCEHKTRDFCQMHCDCDICGKYHPTYNQGIYYQDEKYKQKESPELSIDSIMEESNIDKLKYLLLAVSEDVSLSLYVAKAKKLHLNKDKNKKIMTKIESLENEIKKLKEEME